MSMLTSVLSERESEYIGKGKSYLDDIKYNPDDNSKELSHIDKFLKVISQNSRLEIIYKNVDTAFINTETGIITLPNYILNDRDLYLLMGTHEVSHALNTPLDFYKSHNNTKTPGKIYGVKLNKNLFSCINIVEDIRIEKLMRNQFPGFVAVYKRGYKKLLDSNKNWNLNSQLWSKLSLSNKINAKSKLGDLINYEITDTEYAVLKYMKTAKSFTDVLVRSVYLYKLEMTEELKSKNKLDTKSKNILDKLDVEISDMQEASDMSDDMNDKSIESMIKKMLESASSTINEIEENLERSTGEDIKDSFDSDIIEESREEYSDKNSGKASVNFNPVGTSYEDIIKNPLLSLC